MDLMCFKESLDNMKVIEDNFLYFFDNEENMLENLQNLQTLITDFEAQNNKYIFLSLLDLLAIISNNHHHNLSFYDKITEILKFFKSSIKKFFSNTQIFNIFKKNKRVILSLVDEKIITFDEYIIRKILTDKYIALNYPQYFQPEIKPFINEKWFIKSAQKHNLIDEINKDLPDNFNNDRKIGENDNYIYKLIREDSVTEFISYVNKNNWSLEAKIKQSIFETNSFLIKNKNTKLIEYAAFFGSIQIFHFLILNNVQISPSLWLYAIHGKNPEIIHLLEQNLDDSEYKPYKQFFLESIKCHHNEIAIYIKDSFLQNGVENSSEIFVKKLKYRNFALIENDFNDRSFLYHLCKYNYAFIVDEILKSPVIDINQVFIPKRKFFFK